MAGNKGNGPRLSFHEIANMSQADFNRLMDTEEGQDQVLEELSKAVIGAALGGVGGMPVIRVRTTKIDVHPDFDADLLNDPLVVSVLKKNTVARCCAGCPVQGCPIRLVEFDVVVLNDQIAAARVAAV